MRQLGTQTARVKNVSGGTLTVRGKRLQNNEEYELNSGDILAWDEDPYFQELVASGTLDILTHSVRSFWKKSNPNSSTTSTLWQQKVGMLMDIRETGIYRVGYTADITNSATNQDTVCRVQIDNTQPDVDFQRHRGRDMSSIGGFQYRLLTSGTHTLEMDYKVISGGTATINNARLEYCQESVAVEEA